jgi:hypothetical protein
MSTWRIAQFVIGAVLILLVALFVAGGLANSNAITQVRVQLLPGKEESNDHHLLGIGDGDKLPDYTVRIRTNDRWMQIGTQLNTSAADGLNFPLAESLPVRQALEIQLVEDDKLENDILEQLPINGTKLTGNRFAFEIATERSSRAGMEWFFDTPVGKAISIGITIAVVVVILAAIGPSLP